MLTPFLRENRPGNASVHTGKQPQARPFFQAKLTVNQPGDRYEQEADQVADQVMRMRDGAAPAVGRMAFTPVYNVQRTCAACAHQHEEEGLQRKETGDGTGGQSAPAIVSELLSSGGGQPLDADTQDFMESRMGQDFSQVRVHTGARAAESAGAIQARAYTSGRDVVFGSGEYQPGSPEGLRLLAHELVHVGQQGMGAPAIQRQMVSSSRDTYHTEYAGSSYRVRRTRVPQESRTSRYELPQVGVTVDRRNITLRISWCQGTQGEVRIGANVTGQALTLAQDIAGIITQGGDSSAVLERLQRADVTPFVEAVVARSGQWNIFVRGDVTVGADGVTAGGGSLGVRSGPVDVELAGRGDKDGGSITGNVRITPGRRDESFTCPRRVTVSQTYNTQYLCERLVPARQEQRTRTVERDDVQPHYLYFNYANAIIDETRSQRSLATIQDLLADGYRVTEVAGFTSPEGDLKAGRGFVGNRTLAEQRAGAALTRIQAMCSEMANSLLSMRRCVADAATSVLPIGQKELYGEITSEDGTTRQLSGKALQEHTVEEFRRDEREAPHRDEVFLRSLEGLSAARQADLIYPLLRRAVITLNKRVSETEQYQVDVPGGYQGTTCPEAVIDAARAQFNLQDSLQAR